MSSARKLSGFEVWFYKMQFGTPVRMRIYEKIGKFIQNGVPIPKILDTLWVHLSQDGKKPNAAGAIIVDQWRAAILDGQSFSRALAPWIPPSDLSIIESGEISGNLDKALQDVIFMNEAGKKIRGAMMKLSYPLFLVGLTCIYLFIFGIKIVPAFSGILPPDQWTGVGQYMWMMSKFVQDQLLYWIVGFIALIVVIYQSMGIWTGKLRMQFDKIPPWTIYRLVMGSNFLVALAALVGAGVPTPDALEIMARSGSRWYRERVEATRVAVLNGALNIGEALKRTGYNFPSWDMIVDIQSYASLDGFDVMLSKLAHQWIDETVENINGQIGIIQNVALVVLAVVFITMNSGVFALQQQISAHFGH